MRQHCACTLVGGQGVGERAGWNLVPSLARILWSEAGVTPDPMCMANQTPSEASDEMPSVCIVPRRMHLA
jgi:hypothetical protein